MNWPCWESKRATGDPHYHNSDIRIHQFSSLYHGLNLQQFFSINSENKSVTVTQRESKTVNKQNSNVKDVQQPLNNSHTVKNQQLVPREIGKGPPAIEEWQACQCYG